jgi:hypothetical protein
VNMSDDEEEGGLRIGAGPSVHLAAPLQPRRSSRKQQDEDVNMSDEEEGGLAIGTESNETLLDSGPSVRLAAPLQPRRSSRNIPAINKPSVEYVAPCKLSGGRRMTALIMDEILEASVRIIPSSKSCLIGSI